MRLKSRLALGVAALTLLVAGCGGSTGGRDGGGEPNRSAELRISTNAFGTSFDPHKSLNFATDVPWDFPIYDRLIKLEGTELKPMLAESWELSEDRRTLTFKLRKGVKFHDGTALNAAAVKANIERGQELEGSTVAGAFDIVESVETPDESTVVMNLNADGSLFQYTLADIPGAMISPASFSGDVSQKPVGAGPYKFVRATTDTATYERFEQYYDPDRAKVAKITYRAIPDDTARFNALQTGQLDVIQLPATIFPQAESLADGGDFKIEKAQGSALMGMLLNTESGPLSDVNVRRALNLAVKRDAIVEGMLAGECQPTVQPFTSSSIGYDKSLDGLVKYDPDQAKALLAKAGVSDLRLTVDVVDVSPYTDIATALQAQLAEIGVKLDLKMVVGSEARAEWRKGGYDAFVGLITAGPDPALTLRTSYLETDVPASPATPELGKMADEASKLALDDPEREAAYQEIGKYVAENPTNVPVCAPKFDWLTAGNVTVEDGAFYAYSYIFDPTKLGITG